MQQLLTKGIGHSEFKEVRVGPNRIKIPIKWNLLSLDEISVIKASNVDKKSFDNEIPVNLCNYLNVYNNDYISEEIDFMRATATKHEIDKFKLEIEDVIITKDSETPKDIAVPALVYNDLDNTLCGYHLAILRPIKTKIQGPFLSKALQSYFVKNQFSSLAQGLTRYGLNIVSIKKVLVPTPPLEEQKIIFNILLSVDSKITNEQQYKEKLELLKKGLMQKLLTGELRVKVEGSA